MARRLVDLSHTVEHGLVTLKGFPAPVICDYLSRDDSRAVYAEGTEFHIGRIDMIANTGTYVDSPFHRYADGRDLSELPLEWLADLEGVVVRAEGAGRAVDRDAFAGLDVRGKAVLVHTGHARHWGGERYFEGHPYLTRAAAEHLRDAGARLVGIDSLNIDSTDDPARPVHSILLRADIPICEHMRGLEALPDAGFRFFAVPVKVKAFGTFPVRAFAAV
ncbi:MAG TPA: cyclase family protein [Longimicrobiaceae bacterium]|nr:cyclase family protein [Longimicrobiaceae bacterium]